VAKTTAAEASRRYRQRLSAERWYTKAELDRDVRLYRRSFLRSFGAGAAAQIKAQRTAWSRNWPGSAALQLCPQTAHLEEARHWITELPLTGVEGIVIKGAQTRYRAGQPNWRKFRIYTTTLAIIAGVAGPATQPTTVLLGRFDQSGRLRYVARSHRIGPAVPYGKPPVAAVATASSQPTRHYADDFGTDHDPTLTTRRVTG
jgi:hypothetical protein